MSSTTVQFTVCEKNVAPERLKIVHLQLKHELATHLSSIKGLTQSISQAEVNQNANGNYTVTYRGRCVL